MFQGRIFWLDQKSPCLFCRRNKQKRIKPTKRGKLDIFFIYSPSFLGKSIPSLRRNIKRITAFGYYLFSFFSFSHITDNADLLIEHEFFVIGLSNSEQQFIILAAAERACCRIQFKFESCFSRFFGNRNFFFV